ncbi:MAG: tetratricopeptide repeat protein [Pyrinomonadaceae bacterium]
MSLKLVKPKNSLLARAVFVAMIAAYLFAGWMFVKWNFATAISTHLDTRLAESKLIAEWLADISPNDPNPHYALAGALERSFEPGDFERALTEYERAAELSPNNYLMWLALARASSRSGDVPRAHGAFNRALELAPNYANVQWAYGNFLVRQNRVDEGLAMIAKAAVSNPGYSGPSAVLAMQIFDNDVMRVRNVLGGGEDADVALAPVLSSLKRYDDSFTAWNRLPNDLKSTKYKNLSELMLEHMAGGGQLRYAARITAALAESEASKPVIGNVTNGGFENEVKLKKAGRFEWQIAEGTEPQIGLSQTNKHTGNYGLWIVFNTFATADFRQVSQTVAVEPGAQYKFEVFYISSLKTASRLKFEIVNPATGQSLATTNEMVPGNQWSSLTAQFMVPRDVDGIKIQLLRDGCNGPACPVTGTLALDDISITRLQ